MKTQFNVLSPDGFTISFDKQYKTISEAEKALNEWVKRYELQGYYSTQCREKIPYSEIQNYCRIIEQPKY